MLDVICTGLRSVVTKYWFLLEPDALQHTIAATEVLINNFTELYRFFPGENVISQAETKKLMSENFGVTKIVPIHTYNLLFIAVVEWSEIEDKAGVDTATKSDKLYSHEIDRKILTDLRHPKHDFHSMCE